jgi:hypothetical protein
MAAAIYPHRRWIAWAEANLEDNYKWRRPGFQFIQRTIPVFDRTPR